MAAGGRDPRGRTGVMGAIPLFPSGEDANPLNRRLPAEVITRRRREVKKTEEKPSDEVKVDLKTALSLKPEARLKWLSKAFKMVEEGRAAATELFDILSSRKFATGVPSKICRKLRGVVYESVDVFSEKQRRYLKSDEWALNASCGDGGVEREEKHDDHDDEDGPEPEPKPMPKISRPAKGLLVQPVPRQVSVSLINEQKRSDALASEVRPQQRPSIPVAKIQMDTGGVWMEAEDAAARQREHALERARRDAARAREQAKRQTLEREAQDRAEAEESKRRQLEDQVDDSLMLLERLAEKRQQPERSRSKSRSRRGSRRTRRKRDRRKTSRSISVGSRSRSRRKPGKGKDRVDFSEALARRMREREGDLDSARMPVVDPGHAKRHLAGLL